LKFPKKCQKESESENESTLQSAGGSVVDETVDSKIQSKRHPAFWNIFSGPFWIWHPFLSTIGNVLVFSGLSHLRYHFCFLRGRSP
jgi:hypothetical protein